MQTALPAKIFSDALELLYPSCQLIDRTFIKVSPSPEMDFGQRANKRGQRSQYTSFLQPTNSKVSFVPLAYRTLNSEFTLLSECEKVVAYFFVCLEFKL